MKLNKGKTKNPWIGSTAPQPPVTPALVTKKYSKTIIVVCNTLSTIVKTFCQFCSAWSCISCGLSPWSLPSSTLPLSPFLILSHYVYPCQFFLTPLIILSTLARMFLLLVVDSSLTRNPIVTLPKVFIIAELTQVPPSYCYMCVVQKMFQRFHCFVGI